MSNINLLPWRQELKDRKVQAFYKLLGTFAVIGLGVAALVWFFFDVQISTQNSRLQEWKSQIAIVDAQIAEIAKLKEHRQQLIDRMNAINTLQQSRNIPVHLYSDLPTLVASGIYLTDMNFANRQIRVNGLAESNPRLSSMLRNIDNAKWLGNGSISQTKAEVKDGKKVIPTLPDGLYEFNMAFNVMAEDGIQSNNGGKK